MDFEWGDPDTNPFTPDFGQTPARMGGRDGLLSRIGTGLATGPRHPGFTTLMLGPRGSGKTALLNAVAESAARRGWLVVKLDAATPKTLDRLGSALRMLERPGATGLGGGEAARRQVSDVKVLGAGVGWHPQPPPEPLPDNRYRLAHLAAQAAEHDSGVLLCLDEMTSGDRTEMRRLGNDLQHIVKSESLRLAFMGAGLGELRYGMLSDRNMTFFQRCHQEPVGLLHPAEAAACVRDTFESAGGAVSPEAAAAVMEMGPISAFHLQIAGSAMWSLSGAPARPVVGWQAEQAIRAAARDMHDRVHVRAWHDMPATSRAFMAALARAGVGPVPARDVADMAGLGRKASNDARHRLECGDFVVYDEDTATVALTPLFPADSLLRLADKDGVEAGGSGDRSGAGNGNGRPREEGRCGKPMKRVSGLCVLRAGHPGACRSKR